ncbi:MAG: hypothetical protein COZ25_10800 [Ignavibacteria bacterium CG_4_10_14_3_um_filter_37_18]|nr:MAG: hypothetical protein COZ25_10800 [Ignavibacteria bacterium CG_4_10_14_3_um_filter_37_18]PJC58357.1 MAG: hypothetical protein CO025_09505 [Ignavibacteria bacterium CG_4_9_14_0_2_um_filter_37_13]
MIMCVFGLDSTLTLWALFDIFHIRRMFNKISSLQVKCSIIDCAQFICVSYCSCNRMGGKTPSKWQQATSAANRKQEGGEEIILFMFRKITHKCHSSYN